MFVFLSLFFSFALATPAAHEQLIQRILKEPSHLVNEYNEMCSNRKSPFRDDLSLCQLEPPFFNLYGIAQTLSAIY